MIPTFEYDAVDSHHFRVLTLLPGDRSDDLRGKLHTVLFDEEKVSYEAISYAWHQHPSGTSTDQLCTILCQQDDREGSLNITSNLLDALLQFRDPCRSRLIWVDSICIDQENYEERSLQVQRMATIYRQAEKVLVWLGNDDGFAGPAFKSLRMMAEGKFSHFKPNIRPLAQLSQRSWFFRAWVIQEVVMARNAFVVCGLHTLKFATLQTGFDAVRNYLDRSGADMLDDEDSRNLVPGMIPAMLLCQNVSHCIHYSKPGKRWGSRNTNSRSLKPSASKIVQFGLLLHNLRHCEATDARDKVYAFLGLSHKPIPMLQADYSTPVEDLFVSVAAAILGSGDLEALSLLYFVQTPNDDMKISQTATLPSWVPDWRLKVKMVTLGMSNVVRATGNAQLPVISFPNRRSVSILGARLSIITHITHFVESASTVFQADTFSVQAPDLVESWVNGQPKDKRYPNSSLPYSEAYKMLRQGEWNACTRLLPKQHLNMKLPNRTMPNITHAPSSTWNGLALKHGHVLVLTSDERLGWVPSAARDGDEICLLFGAKIPFVIRKVRQGAYVLVGEALIYGIMHGEAMPDYLRNRPSMDYSTAGHSDWSIDMDKAEQIILE
ncbi:hypothetical protein FKW77_002406 [Venturia effusa]|uniref:Heterokaryon incompatibility domain-containing protein n=1 Tax=Venturia effusa TaxID=50376 RepID=A0A517LIA0_9PEZI|nr:hypothetical protein FKW77_002406 [Venturia effusa]